MRTKLDELNEELEALGDTQGLHDFSDAAAQALGVDAAKLHPFIVGAVIEFAAAMYSHALDDPLRFYTEAMSSFPNRLMLAGLASERVGLDWKTRAAEIDITWPPELLAQGIDSVSAYLATIPVDEAPEAKSAKGGNGNAA